MESLGTGTQKGNKGVKPLFTFLPFYLFTFKAPFLLFYLFTFLPFYFFTFY